MGMKSKSTEQVRQEMNSVFEKIQKKIPEAELIDSIIDGADSHIAKDGDSVGLWYLAKSLELMSQADLVFFVNDYRDYRGCRVEEMCAKAYGKLCIEFVTD